MHRAYRYSRVSIRDSILVSSPLSFLAIPTRALGWKESRFLDPCCVACHFRCVTTSVAVESPARFRFASVSEPPYSRSYSCLRCNRADAESLIGESLEISTVRASEPNDPLTPGKSNLSASTINLNDPAVLKMIPELSALEPTSRLSNETIRKYRAVLLSLPALLVNILSLARCRSQLYLARHVSVP